MKLHSLYYSKKKNGKQRLLMTDSLKKCENYRDSRLATKHSDASKGYYEIREAEPEQKEYKRKSANRKTGYIDKNGWNSHT